MAREDRFSREVGPPGPSRAAGTLGDDPAILRRRLEYAWEEIDQLAKDLALARKTLQEQTDNSAKSLLAAKEEIESLSQSLDEKERTVTAHTEQCRSFEGEIEGLHHALQDKGRLLEEAEARYQQMSEDLQGQIRAVDGLQRKLEQAQAGLRAADEQAAARLTTRQASPASLPDTGIAGKTAGALPALLLARERATALYRQFLADRFLGGLLAGLLAALVVGAMVWPRPQGPQSAGNAVAPAADEQPLSGQDQPPPATEPPKKPPGPVGEVKDPLRNGGQGPRMIMLAGGAFSMGNPNKLLVGEDKKDERPAHEVQIRPFAIGAYEVTFDEYDRFTQATGRRMANDSGQGRGQRPVVDVDWTDAKAYADWLSRQTGHRYRLPSEAEWEYAARAGSKTAYWWGPELKPGQAVCFDCKTQWDNRSTAPVGSFEPNPFGLYDTAGNAMEWVADCYHPNYRDAPADGTAWLDGDCASRVARGGAFNRSDEAMRSLARHRVESEARMNMLGFRLARDP